MIPFRFYFGSFSRYAAKIIMACKTIITSVNYLFVATVPSRNAPLFQRKKNFNAQIHIYFLINYPHFSSWTKATFDCLVIFGDYCKLSALVKVTDKFLLSLLCWLYGNEEQIWRPEVVGIYLCGWRRLTVSQVSCVCACSFSNNTPKWHHSLRSFV